MSNPNDIILNEFDFNINNFENDNKNFIYLIHGTENNKKLNLLNKLYNVNNFDKYIIFTNNSSNFNYIIKEKYVGNYDENYFNFIYEEQIKNINNINNLKILILFDDNYLNKNTSYKVLEELIRYGHKRNISTIYFTSNLTKTKLFNDNINLIIFVDIPKDNIIKEYVKEYLNNLIEIKNGQQRNIYWIKIFYHFIQENRCIIFTNNLYIKQNLSKDDLYKNMFICNY